MAVSMEDVVRVLQNRVGMRWEGLEADGRDEMVKILKKEFDMSNGEADDVLDGLIRSGTLRYEESETMNTSENAGDPGLPPVIPAGVIGTGGISGGSLGGLAVPLAPGNGYWRIGNEDDEGM